MEWESNYRANASSADVWHTAQNPATIDDIPWKQLFSSPSLSDFHCWHTVRAEHSLFVLIRAVLWLCACVCVCSRRLCGYVDAVNWPSVITPVFSLFLYISFNWFKLIWTLLCKLLLTLSHWHTEKCTEFWSATGRKYCNSAGKQRRWFNSMFLIESIQ